MANTAALANSFKAELLNGVHAFGATVIRAAANKDAFKMALFLASATLGAGTTVYAAAGEVTGAGYTAGGVGVTNATDPTLSGATAMWTPSGAAAWTNVTLNVAFDAVLLYNATQGNKAVGVYTFGSQTVTAGNFSLTMPVNDAANALLRVA